MSVTNPIYQVNYLGTGTLGPYAITFDVTLDGGGNAQDINVQVLDPSGTLTDITSSSTVTGLNVYTAIAYGVTYTVVISRYPDLTQPYSFPYGTKFPSRTFESAIDRQCFLLQRLYGDANLALKAPIAESAPGRIPSKASRANQLLGFDSNGDPIPAVGGAVPVTPFMATVLDDTTQIAARTTLGIRARPYLVAAYGSSSEWQAGADVVMTSGQDLVPVLSAAIAAGETWVHLSPGAFVYKSQLTISTAIAFKLTGSGMDHTVIMNDASATGFIEIATGDCKVTGEDFWIYFSGDASGFGGEGIIYGQSWVFQYTSRWKNVKIEITGATSLTTATVSAFSYVSRLTNCEVYIHDNTDSDVSFIGYDNCGRLIGCELYYKNQGSITTESYGFSQCGYLANCQCKSNSLSTTGKFVSYDYCQSISGAFANGDSTGVSTNYGYSNCSSMVLCLATGTKGTAYYGSNYLSQCTAASCAATGFNSCAYLSSCYAGNNTGSGFASCTYLSACYAQNNTVDGFVSCQHITGSHSESNGAVGMSTCKQCQQNYSHGNTTNQYGTGGTQSYADQSTNACANTAAGGYNR